MVIVQDYTQRHRDMSWQKTTPNAIQVLSLNRDQFLPKILLAHHSHRILHKRWRTYRIYLLDKLNASFYNKIFKIIKQKNIGFHRPGRCYYSSHKKTHVYEVVTVKGNLITEKISFLSTIYIIIPRYITLLCCVKTQCQFCDLSSRKCK